MNDSPNQSREEFLRGVIEIEQRNRKRRKYFAWAILVAVSFVFSLPTKIPVVTFFFELAIFGFWAFIITSSITNKRNKQIRQMLREHSDEMLRKLLEAAFPGAEYKPAEFINPDILVTPFGPAGSNRVSAGSDYIHCPYRGYEFALCEAKLLTDYGEDETVLCDGIGLVLLTGRNAPVSVARRVVSGRKGTPAAEYVYKNPDKELTDRLLPEEWLFRLHGIYNGDVHTCHLSNGALVLCLNTQRHLFTFPDTSVTPEDIRLSLEGDIANIKALLDAVLSNNP